MEPEGWLIISIIAIALIFDFINGFHDAANSIATIVTTGVLTPKQAVVWAAFFNFIAFFVFSLMVARTIGQGLIEQSIMDASLIVSALIAAIVWNLLTWYWGLPTSSSHALIGGLAGSALVKGGFSALILSGFIKVLVGIFIAPVLGIMTGLLFIYLFNKLANQFKASMVNQTFKALQLISSAFLSLTHGGNDAQKTMGMIAGLLFSVGWLGSTFFVPMWVVILCQLVISLGTLAGGWRIVHTLGYKITELNPLRGCSAEAGAALMIFIATEFGIPVSTTHVVTGSIAGVGLVKKTGMMGTRWAVLRRIFYVWLITMPVAAIISSLITLLLMHSFA